MSGIRIMSVAKYTIWPTRIQNQSARKSHRGACRTCDASAHALTAPIPADMNGSTIALNSRAAPFVLTVATHHNTDHTASSDHCHRFVAPPAQESVGGSRSNGNNPVTARLSHTIAPDTIEAWKTK